MLRLFVMTLNHWAAMKDDRGASMVEYALLVVLIALIAFLAVKFAGRQVSGVFSEIGDSLAKA